MYLFVKMVNATSAICDMVHAGISTPVKSRVIKIKLTPEQIEILKPRPCGILNRKETYEETELLSLQEDGLEWKKGL